MRICQTERLVAYSGETKRFGKYQDENDTCMHLNNLH